MCDPVEGRNGAQDGAPNEAPHGAQPGAHEGALPSDLASLEPSTISHEEMHRLTRLAAAAANGWRLREAFLLLALQESAFYRVIGCSSVEQYAERHYRLSHRETSEMVRVAKALKDLPNLREAFAAGFLSWGVVRELTRVATAETEAEWLAFAEKKTVRQIRIEVEEALAKKRTRPRKDGRSLPNTTVNVTYKFLRSEHEVILKASEKVSPEIERSRPLRCARSWGA
jgi:hypothetical protein